MNTSVSVDKVALGFLLAAPIPRALAGFFNALVANFLPALAEIFPKFLKKLNNHSAFIVLSLTVIDIFLKQKEQKTFSTLIPLEVMSP